MPTSVIIPWWVPVSIVVGIVAYIVARIIIPLILVIRSKKRSNSCITYKCDKKSLYFKIEPVNDKNIENDKNATASRSEEFVPRIIYPPKAKK